MTEYKNIFGDLGCLPGEHKIHVEETIAPVAQSYRKVLFELRERVSMHGTAECDQEN